MKRALALFLAAGPLLIGAAHAAPIKLNGLPVTVEPNAKLLTLPPESIAKAFPSAAGRPDAVFVTEDRKVTISFEWRQGKLAPNEIEKLAAQFPAVIRAQVPNLKTLKSGVVQQGGTSWAQFVFTTPGRGDDMRRELLVTSLSGRMLVLTVAGNVKDYSRNEAVVRNLAGTVRLN